MTDKNSWIAGINPVTEALKNSERACEKLIFSRSPVSIQEILNLSKKRNLKIKKVEKKFIDRVTDNIKHQGVALKTNAYKFHDEHAISDIINASTQAPLILVIDNINDPGNLGAMIRSAQIAGADAVVIPKDRSSGITPTVLKAAAGAIEYIPLVRVTNLSRFLQNIKKQGIWVIGLSPVSDSCIFEHDLTCPVALVIGGEAKGIRLQVKKQCDIKTGIPQITHGVSSLNASASCAVALFEVIRQRKFAKK